MYFSAGPDLQSNAVQLYDCQDGANLEFNFTLITCLIILPN